MIFFFFFRFLKYKVNEILWNRTDTSQAIGRAVVLNVSRPQNIFVGDLQYCCLDLEHNFDIISKMPRRRGNMEEKEEKVKRQTKTTTP
jgi:hypothetical protein